MIRGPLVAVVAVLGVSLLGCVPSESGGLTEVDDEEDARRPSDDAPVFPESGVVPDDLLVEGLTHDLARSPRDLAFWAPPPAEARCAAEAVVESVGGERLSALGYRPGVDGASLNAIGLDASERRSVIDAFETCVDMTEGIAAIFYGDGRMAPTVATCIADGLADADQLEPFVRAWAFGTAVDPFEGDSPLADAMLNQAVVCVPDGALDWPSVDLPGDEPIRDRNAPPGVSGSPFADDQSTTTAPDADGDDGDTAGP